MPFKHRYDRERHFVRHGQQFSVGNADQYERLADQFLIGPVREGALECFRTNGDRVRFDPRTEEFGVLSRAGYV